MKKPALDTRAGGEELLRSGQGSRPAAAAVAPTRQRVGRSPGRIVVEGCQRDAGGVLAELSDDPDCVEWVALRHRLRTIVLRRAPRDLSALGIEHAHLRWSRAVELIHETERVATIEMERPFRLLQFQIEIQRAWESRGSPGFGPTKDDVREAELRILADYA